METTIYKLIKPNDPMTVYIGKTTVSLKKRLQRHKSASKIKEKSHLKISKWFDDSCEIELIEICNENENVRELQIVQEYIDKGYSVMNTYDGRKLLDPTNYNIKNNTKNRNKRHPDYHSWCNKICRKASKESLTMKEYLSKHNIPEYSGPKKIIN